MCKILLFLLVCFISTSIEAQTGSVSITTTPDEGAQVTIDGKRYTATTPCIIEGLEPGIHSLKLEQEYFLTEMLEFQISANHKTTLNIPMYTTAAFVEIITNDQADVFINGQHKCTGTFKGRLPAGTYSLEARQKGYQTAKQTISIEEDQNYQVRLALTAQSGALEVNTFPANATVFINGTDKGETPITIANLAPGTYKVEVKRLGFITETQSIEIISDQTKDINLVMKHEEKKVPPPRVVEDKKAEPLPTYQDEKTGEVFFIVENMPAFQGGNLDNFRIWVVQNLVYPAEAQQMGITGRVYVQFIVSSRGNLTDVKILRGADPLLDAEALRVIKSSPIWTPGTQRGKPVAVQFTMPINFNLN